MNTLNLINIWEIAKPWIFEKGLKIIVIILVAWIFHAILKRAITKMVERLIVAKDGVSIDAE